MVITMAKKKESENALFDEFDELDTSFDAGDLEATCCDDDLGIEYHTQYPWEEQKAACFCLTLPMDQRTLSAMLNSEAEGKIIIKDKQLVPCPKEGMILAYIETSKL